jgi:hypothetical protein
VVAVLVVKILATLAAVDKQIIMEHQAEPLAPYQI